MAGPASGTTKDQRSTRSAVHVVISAGREVGGRYVNCFWTNSPEFSQTNTLQGQTAVLGRNRQYGLFSLIFPLSFPSLGKIQNVSLAPLGRQLSEGFLCAEIFLACSFGSRSGMFFILGHNGCWHVSFASALPRKFHL